MGYFVNLFGSKESEGQKALRKALVIIQRVIEDEEHQLEFVHPMMKSMILVNPDFDKDPKGTSLFGLLNRIRSRPMVRLGNSRICRNWKPPAASASCSIAWAPSEPSTPSRP